MCFFGIESSDANLHSSVTNQQWSTMNRITCFFPRAAVLALLVLSASVVRADDKVPEDTSAGFVNVSGEYGGYTAPACNCETCRCEAGTCADCRDLPEDGGSFLSRVKHSWNKHVEHPIAEHSRHFRRWWFRHEQKKKFLQHPECPPHFHPTWGYYPTCWRRFPDHCYHCPPANGANIPTHGEPVPNGSQTIPPEPGSSQTPRRQSPPLPTGYTPVTPPEQTFRGEPPVRPLEYISSQRSHSWQPTQDIRK